MLEALDTINSLEKQTEVKQAAKSGCSFGNWEKTTDLRLALSFTSKIVPSRTKRAALFSKFKRENSLIFKENFYKDY